MSSKEITLDNYFKFTLPRIKNVSVILSSTSQGWGCFIHYDFYEENKGYTHEQTGVYYDKDAARALSRACAEIRTQK